MNLRLILLGLFTSLIVKAGDKISIAPIFTDNMVLQREKSVKIWGEGPSSKEVEVFFNNQHVKTRSSNEGEWTLYLSKMESSNVNQTMLVVCGKDTITLNNILVGDIWLAGGQSNMAFKVSTMKDKEVLVNSLKNNDKVRYYRIAQIVAGGKRLNQKDGPWEQAQDADLSEWSALPAYFSKFIQESQNIPIGIINSSHGGSTADSWISDSFFKKNPLLDSTQTIFLKDEQIGSLFRNRGVLYNSMLSKVVGYTIKGVIWYQGESNADLASEYRTVFGGVIDCWREAWNDNFPFIFAQLPAYGKKDADPNKHSWALIREAQLKTYLEKENVAMVVTVDGGEEKNIHPRNKALVGDRMVLIAREKVYGEKVLGSSPIFENINIKSNQVEMTFMNSQGGLVAHGELKEFEICGEDGKYYRADARISKSKVIVSSKEVNNPVAVRYSWRNYNSVSVYNKAGLPVSPFRTNEKY